MNNKLSKEQQERQIRKEAKATVILFAICCIWHVACAYGLTGCGIRIMGLPLWWILSTLGVFVIGVVGVIVLVKKVFVDFDLDDDSEGGAEHAE